MFNGCSEKERGTCYCHLNNKSCYTLFFRAGILVILVAPRLN